MAANYTYNMDDCIFSLLFRLLEGRNTFVRLLEMTLLLDAVEAPRQWMVDWAFL